MIKTPSSIRRKRNFKNLTLENSPVVAQQSPDDQPSNTTNVANSKPKSDKPPTGGAEGRDPYGKFLEQLKDLEIGLELMLDVRAEDLKPLEELGAGNGGTVTKVLHMPTKTVMAKKIIHVDAKPNVRKQILREMQFMHDCNHRHIVSFYGAFMNGNDISICMEYMDVGSLDKIYKKNGPIPMGVIGKITSAVLDGLIYLYDNHRIIHRDVKPSNILVNSSGQIKLCDFGVSGQLINSIADTFVGTSSYMSPERIQGAAYTVKSDIWSLGITLMELALGRFPLTPDGKPLSIFELLQHIVHEPVPTLPPGKFPPDFENFVEKRYTEIFLFAIHLSINPIYTYSLIKEVKDRPTPKELRTHPFLVVASAEKVDLEKWAQNLE
ncbi:uncharacterized protein VTP21DRAFT_4632 [Calcarisporiella thermophila]|uniref:uncharacterized protein n=1 Tax=Calcarisporiella thermophila TaxID=911321 RepID=UPI003742BD11